MEQGLNPYCSGRWSRTVHIYRKGLKGRVLILVVVEDGLVLNNGTEYHPSGKS